MGELLHELLKSVAGRLTNYLSSVVIHNDKLFKCINYLSYTVIHHDKLFVLRSNQPWEIICPIIIVINNDKLSDFAQYSNQPTVTPHPHSKKKRLEIYGKTLWTVAVCGPGISWLQLMQLLGCQHVCLHSCACCKLMLCSSVMTEIVYCLLKVCYVFPVICIRAFFLLLFFFGGGVKVDGVLFVYNCNDVYSDRYFMCILWNVLRELCLYALCTCLIIL